MIYQSNTKLIPFSKKHYLLQEGKKKKEKRSKDHICGQMKENNEQQENVISFE